ncbi:MAG: sodium-dependent transporter [Anaerolineaceae bacterium]|nr:sodium-dependent transporter [Anaerolineaceae bacterium]
MEVQSDVKDGGVEVVSAGKQRDGFTSGLGVIAATLGSAVGLGNIWKFPSLTGLNGGAAFIVVYLLSTLLVGLPIMISELMLGRAAKANAVTTLKRMAPKNQPWWLVGVAGVAAAFLILAFYTEVAAWVFAYIFKSFSGALLSTDPKITSQAFTQLISDPAQSLIWQWVVLALIAFIIILGVSKGIEKTTKRLMPVLFVLLVAICLRSVSLPGAGQGLAFLFKPDFSKLTWAIVLSAMGLSFFKLSVGMGTMITYGSYFRDDQNIPLTAVRVMLADLLVSMLAGIAIFPAVFAFGFKPDAGPSLLFITIPAVFAAIPLGNVFLPLFFVLAAVAATGAMLSLLEVPVAFLNESLGWSRLKATLVVIVVLGLVGSTAALSNNLLANFKLFGMTPFDLFDYLTSNILLPVGGICLAIFAGWVWGFGRVKTALSNQGVLKNEKVIRAFFLVVKVITPVLVLLVLLQGLKVI